jgi:hypothetical protein
MEEARQNFWRTLLLGHDSVLEEARTMLSSLRGATFLIQCWLHKNLTGVAISGEASSPPPYFRIGGDSAEKEGSVSHRILASRVELQ